MKARYIQLSVRIMRHIDYRDYAGVRIDIDEPFDGKVHTYAVRGPRGNGRVLLWYDGDKLIGSASEGTDYTDCVLDSEKSGLLPALASEDSKSPSVERSYPRRAHARINIT